jgi:NitT/TauT family transport system permease protein
MSTAAMERPAVRRGAPVLHAFRRAASLLAGLGVLWGLWEGYSWIGIREHLTWPFTVDRINMPHVHTILKAFGEPLQPDGPPLRHYLYHWALFTAKEALAGFALGALIGFVLAIVLAHSGVLRRGLVPYIVVSQTVPILAVAPMVVVGLGSKGVEPWQAVAVIAAYLTFFPVAINTLRGLQSPDPRALELMRSYAAGRWAILWRLRVPASLPFVFSALKISATASVIGAIIGETPASIQQGLGGAIVSFNQYYSIQPANLWATILVCAALGILLFLGVVLVERLVLRRAPEHVA